MIKRLFVFTSLVIFAGSLRSQGFYNLAADGLNGNPLQLSNYIGKKVLVVVLPLSQSDPNYGELITFKQRFGDTVAVIGVPSLEDGYQPADSATIRSLYAASGIVLTQGVYTKKASAGQSPLLTWLTDRFKNQHFDMDARGTGTAFFISKTGKLFAVLPPEASLQSNLVNRIVHSTSQ